MDYPVGSGTIDPRLLSLPHIKARNGRTDESLDDCSHNNMEIERSTSIIAPLDYGYSANCEPGNPKMLPSSKYADAEDICIRQLGGQCICTTCFEKDLRRDQTFQPINESHVDWSEESYSVAVQNQDKESYVESTKHNLLKPVQRNACAASGRARPRRRRGRTRTAISTDQEMAELLQRAFHLEPSQSWDDFHSRMLHLRPIIEGGGKSRQVSRMSTVSTAEGLATYQKTGTSSIPQLCPLLFNTTPQNGKMVESGGSVIISSNDVGPRSADGSFLGPNWNLQGIEHIYQCTYSCGKTFPEQFEWKRHEESIHWNNFRFMCLECDDGVTDPFGVTVCSFCSLPFVNSEAVQLHNLQCPGARSALSSFPRKDKLLQHLSKCHGMQGMADRVSRWVYPVDGSWPRECGFCGMHLTEWNSRAIHIEEHFMAGYRISQWRVPFHAPKDGKENDVRGLHETDEDDDDDEHHYTDKVNFDGFLNYANKNHATTSNHSQSAAGPFYSGTGHTYQQLGNGITHDLEHISLSEHKISATKLFSTPTLGSPSLGKPFHGPITRTSELARGSSNLHNHGPISTSIEMYLSCLVSPFAESFLCGHRYSKPLVRSSMTNISSIGLPKHPIAPISKVLLDRVSNSSGSGIVSSSSSVSNSEAGSQSSKWSAYSGKALTSASDLSVSVPPWHIQPAPVVPLDRQLTMGEWDYGYDLPCEFAFAGCELRFYPGHFEAWLTHTRSHFGDAGPPLKSVCSFCDQEFQSDGKNVQGKWFERMIHHGSHLQDLTPSGAMRPDFFVINHMKANNLINDLDYNHALLYTERPYCDGLVPPSFQLTHREGNRNKTASVPHDLEQEGRQRRKGHKKQGNLPSTADLQSHGTSLQRKVTRATHDRRRSNRRVQIMVTNQSQNEKLEQSSESRSSSNSSGLSRNPCNPSDISIFDGASMASTRSTLSKCSRPPDKRASTVSTMSATNIETEPMIKYGLKNSNQIKLVKGDTELSNQVTIQSVPVSAPVPAVTPIVAGTRQAKISPMKLRSRHGYRNNQMKPIIRNSLPKISENESLRPVTRANSRSSSVVSDYRSSASKKETTKTKYRVPDNDKKYITTTSRGNVDVTHHYLGRVDMAAPRASDAISSDYGRTRDRHRRSRR